MTLSREDVRVMAEQSAKPYGTIDERYLRDWCKDLAASHEVQRTQLETDVGVMGQMAQALARIEELKEALASLPAKFDSVDNGHCTVCGGYRLFDVPAMTPGICENEDCWSHVRRLALNPRKEGE